MNCKHCGRPLEADPGSITGWLHADNSELVCIVFDARRQRFSSEIAEPAEAACDG